MSKTSEALAAVRVAHAIAESIRELGEIPSGHLYARLMGIMDLRQYEQVIDLPWPRADADEQVFEYEKKLRKVFAERAGVTI